MVRKSKRIQSIQRRESLSRATKPRAAPLCTTTASPASSSHTVCTTATQVASNFVESNAIDEARQCHDAGSAPITPEEASSSDVTPTEIPSEYQDANINIGELGSARLDQRSSTEHKEQELMQQYLQAGADTMLTTRPISSPVEVLGYIQTHPEVDALLPLSDGDQLSAQRAPKASSYPHPANDPLLELIQNAISSVISPLSTHSSSESESGSEAIDTIHATARATISQLEVIFCTACFERIKVLERERNAIREDLERSHVECECMIKRVKELEARVRGCKKTKFVPGC